MAFRYHLVDEYWTHLGWFESEIPHWSVGQTFVAPDGRSFAITAITPNPDTEGDFTATWTVEAA